ncbi:hypothetical protein [Nonomuraea longispora]|uniref:hypothetical protein n=1 Tax=Nonomuraea longispora TaxID=1848320 RepID=UPI003CCC8B8D
MEPYETGTLDVGDGNELSWEVSGNPEGPAGHVPAAHAWAAWDLHPAWPGADFQLVDDAGHAGAEPGTLHRLVAATDRFRGGA